MKKRIRNIVGIAMMMLAIILFGLVQQSTPTVKALGCPDAGTVGCNCQYVYSVESWVWYNDEWHVATECHYSCVVCGSGGGGDPMYIEQTVTVFD